MAALPRVPDLPLPRSGSLFFFYDAENQPWGYDPNDVGCCRVIYSPSVLSENNPRRFPLDLDEDARYRAVAYTAAAETSLPGINHGPFRDLRPSADELEIYQKIVDPLRGPVYRMGGHADEIQGDIRLEAQMVSNGINCGTASGFARGRRKGLHAGASDWRLLLQVDSEDRTGMFWGDAGRLYFLIRLDDLRLRRFDKVWLILQCT